MPLSNCSYCKICDQNLLEGNEDYKKNLKSELDMITKA